MDSKNHIYSQPSLKSLKKKYLKLCHDIDELELSLSSISEEVGKLA